MKKILTTAAIIFGLMPFTAQATTPAAWNATGTPPVSFIQPNVINGITQALNINGTATSTINKLKVGSLEAPIFSSGTCTGNAFSVDTPTFVVDCTNHRAGVGTTTPASIFEIVSNNPHLTIKDSNASQNANIDFVDAANTVRGNIQYTANSMQFLANNGGGGAFIFNNQTGETMRIGGGVGGATANYVSIGSSTPSAKLTVQDSNSYMTFSGATSNGYAQQSIIGGFSTVSPILVLGRTTQDALFGIASSFDTLINTGVNPGDFVVRMFDNTRSFIVGYNNSTQYLTVKAGGNIGISTSTPSGKLSISSANSLVSQPLFIVASSSAAVATATPFIINAVGNIGISVPAPLSPLDVQDNSSATNGGITVRRNSTQYISINEGATATHYIQAFGSKHFVFTNQDATANGVAFQFNGNGSTAENNGTALLTMLNNGNIGVSTTTPYATLSVQSNASTGDAFVVATSSGAAVFGVDNDGHQFTSGPAPVISTCGTGTGTVVGDDQSGTITTATAATACTATFSKAYRSTPVCTVTDNSLVGFADIASVSVSAVTFGISSALTGGNLYYSCSYHK